MLLCMTLELTPKLLSLEQCCLLLNAVLLVTGVGFCASAFFAQILFDIFTLIQPGADKIEKLINKFVSPSLLNVNGAVDLI